jgi:hypothetical protein
MASDTSGYSMTRDYDDTRSADQGVVGDSAGTRPEASSNLDDCSTTP